MEGWHFTLHVIKNKVPFQVLMKMGMRNYQKKS